MPITKEKQKLYGTRKEWRAIVEKVRDRSGDRCEWPGCGVKNHQEGVRYPDGRFEPFVEPFPEDCPGETYFDRDFWEVDGAKIIRIVLTTAHLDHDPTNMDLDNLRHWCQYHHLRYDAQHHAENARKTREARALRLQPTLEGI